MEKIGFWKTSKGFISHKQGLSEEQVTILKNLKAGDRLVLFTNDVREGEKGAHLSMARSTIPTAEPVSK
jgi:hypothetical protein